MDDLTFRVQFGGDGVARLRDRVKEKLKEFMGDYTDDTLVEYVIVLLKNGRCKEEAKSELNVFLGDDSDSFVSWLWDHLKSNIDLYVQPGKSCADEVVKPKSSSGEQGGKTDSRRLDPEPEKENSNKLSKTRHSKEWKGLVQDIDKPPPLRSAVITNIDRNGETDGTIGQVKGSVSPRPVTQRKRSRPDERPQVKREVVSKETNGAPRRLLQFAVRDAVATSRPSSLTAEPSFKRLRSVVSTSTEEFPLESRPQRIRSVARVPNAMAVAIKAVAEAAKDVVKVKPSGNVFDRLGRGMDVPDTTDNLAEYRESSGEYDGEYRKFTQVLERSQYVRNMPKLASDARMGSDFLSDNEDYDNVLGRGVMDVYETGTSGINKGDDSLMVEYTVDNNVDEMARKLRNVQDQPAVAAITSSNIVKSMNVSTWKPSHYQDSRGVSNLENQKLVQEGEPGAGRSGVRPIKENNNHIAVINGNAPNVDAHQDSQKTLPSTGLYFTGRPIEDADSRTIFVSNVHFAATKDSLSRHFNKFGEVLKVVIITDAATGQPKGSAYVEFTRKEAAEHALSLDGASFMSRILKVVKKSSAPHEGAPTVTWPRVGRGSPFGASRFARGVTYPRGMTSIYRSRLPIKPGARSLQWKRGDAQSGTPSESSSLVSSNPIPSPTSRSLTYVRTEPKTNGNSGTA